MMARRKAGTCPREYSIIKVLHEVVLLGKYDKSGVKRAQHDDETSVKA